MSDFGISIINGKKTFDLSIAKHGRKKLTVTNDNPSSVRSSINFEMPKDMPD